MDVSMKEKRSKPTAEEAGLQKRHGLNFKGMEQPAGFISFGTSVMKQCRNQLPNSVSKDLFKVFITSSASVSYLVKNDYACLSRGTIVRSSMQNGPATFLA